MPHTLEKPVEVAVSPEMALADKLLNRETIVKDDIRALDLFGDKYIEMLLNTPQSHVRNKLAEVLAHLWRDEHDGAKRFNGRSEENCGR